MQDVFKITPELLLSYGPVALESQYYYMTVSRSEGLPRYHAQGAYGILRGLLLGDKEYSYSGGNAGLELPRPEAWRLRSVTTTPTLVPQVSMAVSPVITVSLSTIISTSICWPDSDGITPMSETALYRRIATSIHFRHASNSNSKWKPYLRSRT